MLNLVSPATLWLIVCIVLAVLEMIIPGFIIGFFSLGALVTMLTVMIGLTSSFVSQMIVFLGTSVVFLILFHKVWKKKSKGNSSGDTTNFSLQLGKIIPVVEFIDPEQGCGKVRYQGAVWNASAKEKIAPGESVRLTGCDNLTLFVEPVEIKGEKK